MRRLRFFIVIFTFATLAFAGGMAGTLFAEPLLSRMPFLSSLSLLKSLRDRVTVIEERQEVIVDKADAPARAIEQVKPSVGVIERFSGASRKASASGVVITNDGWVVTSSNVVGSQSGAANATFVVVRRGQTIRASLVAVDRVRGLALFAAQEAKEDRVPEFVSFEDRALGDTVLLLSAAVEETLEHNVEVGYLARLTPSAVEFSPAFGASSPDGAVVITTEGKLMGIMTRSAENKILFVPARAISEFMASSKKPQ